MTTITQFIKLMKSEPRKRKRRWIIGEDKIFSIEEIDRIRNVCWKLKWDGIKGKKYYLVRDWFMIQLGLFTGLRVDEMRQLKIEDIHIRGSHSSLFVKNGKGGRKRNVWINAEFKEICEEFLKLRKRFGFDDNTDCCVFVSDAGTTLSKRAIQKSFKRCVKTAGLTEKYSIHCLRHTYATYLLKASRNIKLVKEQLGHSSIKTTEIYISLIKEDTKEALKNLYKVERPFIKLPKPKKKSRYRLKHISCEYVKPGTIGRKPYNQDHSTPEERWEEVVRICTEIIAEHGSIDRE
ncbi:MAG: tyrosine-type recombinase/integrase [Candidatus Aureabacteria bacterium]|nr:tyrosine-type recombinase/integrase [Candidatus Auribacterota bacterium]